MAIFSCLMVLFLTYFVNSEIYDVSTALKVQLTGAFPANAFNQSCVASSCPRLNDPNVCSTSDSSYDLSATMTALSECLKGTVCGIKIEPRPFTPVQFSMSQVLQGVPLAGVCNNNPNGVYANVIPRFSILSDNTVAVSLPNLTFMGNISCQFNRINSSLDLLPTQANTGFRHSFNYSSLVAINANPNGEVSIAINNPQMQVKSLNFSGLQFPSFPGTPDFLPTFKTLVIDALGKMGLSTFLRDFYKSLLQSALQVAQNNCKE